MIFTEARFLLFLVVTFGVHWRLRSNDARKNWLLAASCVFYGAWSVVFLALMLATALVDWGAGRLLERAADPRRRKAILIASLVCNLGVLGFFKYWNFFAESAAAALTGLGFDAHLRTLEIVLPVGISFYTFQSLSYTIDVYRGELATVRSARDFLLFVTFFPQLVAGPIVRASDFLWQLTTARELATVRWRNCALLFLVGFFKKACLADQIAVAVDQVFASPTEWNAASLWLADVLYAIQIYCDFSGYSDMAIALAGLFGYTLTPNFDFPYLARSVTRFWRCWHISLSTWFRDYLYIPLGGNRGGTARTGFNLLLVFFLCGLWHGAAWTFVVWGLLHGTALLLERIGIARLLERLPAAVGHAWTLFVVLIAWVAFRAQGLATTVDYWRGLLGGGDGTLALGWHLWLPVLLFASGHVLMRHERLLPRAIWTLPRWAFAALIGLATAALLPWIATGTKPFIYFQF